MSIALPLLVPSEAEAVQNNPILVYGSKGYFSSTQAVEDVSQRTEFGKVTVLSSGKTTTYNSMMPVHYKDNYSDSNEQWKDIDLTITNNKITKAPYNLTIDPNTKTITVQDKKTGSVVSLSLASIGSETIKASVLPQVSTGKVQWTNIATDTDLIIQADNDGVRFQRILKSSKAPLDAKFGIVKVGNGLQVTSKIQDSSAGKNGLSVLASTTSNVLVETVADSSKIKAYPVTIDPDVSVFVGANSDDANVFWDGAAWNYAVGAINEAYVGYFVGASQMMGEGMRWLNVTVPNAATITSANITVRCQTANANDNVITKIVGHKVPDSWTFANLTDYQARRGTEVGGPNNTYRTIAEVYWNPMPHFVLNTDYTSPNIATVIQEIVNQAGWAYGNSMALFIDDHCGNSTAVNNTYRRWYSYDSGASYTALNITYAGVAFPTVTTLAATLVEETTATTGGDCIDIGATNVTSWGTQYGTTGAYGSWQNNTGLETAPFAWNDNLVGLSPGTLYYFRAWANNTAGYGYGAQATFLTKPNATTSFNCYDTGNTTSIYLNWTASLGTTTYQVRYNNTTYPVTVADGYAGYNNTALFYTQGGLSPSSTYYFRNWSWASAGGLTQYSDGNVVCSCITPTIPVVITDSCTGVGQDPTGTWWSIVNGHIVNIGSTPASQTLFNYGLTAGYGANVTSTGTWHSGDTFWNVIQGLAANSTYHYQAGAYNGFWGYGADATFYTADNTTMVMRDVKVFQSVKESGDWLITCLYKNIYPPFYDSFDVTRYFTIELIDTDGTVVASSACPQWGLRPAGLYFSAAQVASLEWGRMYRVRLQCNQSPFAYMSYPIFPADWRGTNLSELDSWILTTASALENNDLVTYTVSVASKGKVLNDAGGVLFDACIQGLSTMRPSMFGTLIEKIGYQAGTPSTTSFAPVWQTNLGPYITQAFTQAGNVLSVSGKTFGGFLFFGLALIIALIAVPRGHIIIPVIMVLAFIPYGVWLGLVFPAVLGLTVAVLGLVLVIQLWWRRS